MHEQDVPHMTLCDCQLVHTEVSADDMPRLLARFKVNEHNTIAVFTASTKEDFSYFRDVVGLLPANTPGTTTGKMTYLIARLEVSSQSVDVEEGCTEGGHVCAFSHIFSLH